MGGKAKTCIDPRARRPALQGETNVPSGVTAWRKKMMTTISSVASKSVLAPVLAMMVMGLALMFVAGHAQSSVLHDAAHDMRHATGFPCH